MNFFLKPGFLILIILFAAYAANSQLSIAEYHKMLKESQADTSRINIFHQLSLKHQRENKDSSKYYELQGLRLAEQIGEPWWIIQCHMWVGTIFHNSGDLVEGKNYNLNAVKLIKRYGINEFEGNALNNLGNSYKRLAMVDSAFYHFIESEKAFLKVGERYNVWRTYIGIALLFNDQKEIDRAIEYALKAYEIVKQGKSRIDLGYVIYNLTFMYFLKGDIEHFAEFTEKWYEFQREGKSSLALDDERHAGLMIFYQDDVDDLEVKIKAAFEYELGKGNFLMAGNHYHALGYFFKNNNETDKAVLVWEKASEQFKKINSKYNLYDCYSQLYEHFKITDNTSRALEYLELKSALKDSLQEESSMRNFRELEVKYETEKKDLEISKKTLQRNLFLAGAIIFAMLAFVIFLLLRNRLMNNKKLASIEKKVQDQKIQQLEQEKKITAYNSLIEGQEQEQERIAKDLHDSIGGLLSSVKAHFNALREDRKDASNNIFQKTDHLIDEACEEVRRISHNMMPRAIELSGLEEAVADLCEGLQKLGYECDYKAIGLNNQLNKKTATMIYRVLQELIHNIRKHARAQSIFIQLIQHPTALDVLVEDDGIGFDFGAVQDNGGLGLQSIDYRIKYLSGTLDFDSIPNEGTTVTIHIPI